MTLLAFQGISSFYTPRQLEVSGMSPVQSVSNVPGLYQKLAQPGRAGYIKRRLYFLLRCLIRASI